MCHKVNQILKLKPLSMAVRRLLPVCLGLVLSLGAYGQSRRYVAQFNQLQGYFNPAMTAWDGSAVKSLARNQWTSWEGAPKTYTFAAELDFAEKRRPNDLGKNAIGINFIREQFGAFRENELIANYSSRIRISEKTILRFGLGVNLNQTQLDENSLATEQSNDATVNQYLGGVARMNTIDFNSGLAFVHPKYYISYGMQNINQGKNSTGNVFFENKSRVNIVQAGYKQRINNKMDLSFDGMWRNQSDLSDNLEMNLRLILMDSFWVGSGLRVKYANSMQLGFLFDRVKLAYIYEVPISRKDNLLPNITNEFTLTYSIFARNKASVW
jgi:type IX secretion system PorP/SprF family membrane protein